MDAKMTKLRIGRMLSYDWLKIIGLALAAIFVWYFVFTVSATRITPAQQFTVVNYFGNVSMSNTELGEKLQEALNKNVFSYEVIETSTVDVPLGGDQGYALVESRFATSEGDVVFVPNIDDPDSAVEENGETRYDTYLQKLVRSYGYALYNLDPNDENGYFKQMEAFLNRYYDGGWENGALNKAQVESDFRARITKNKDKRFKKDHEIERGIQSEIERIEKYREGLKEFYGYMEAGLVAFPTTQVLNDTDGSVIREGIFYINLCPDVNTMGELKNAVAYGVDNEDGSVKYTAENMCVAFMRFSDLEQSFEYEDLLFVNMLIKQYKAA